MGDVEGVEVCGELERGGHQADKAGQEQQVDELNIIEEKHNAFMCTRRRFMCTRRRFMCTRRRFMCTRRRFL